MKKVFFVITLLFVLGGCWQKFEQDNYSKFKPVLMKESEFLNSVHVLGQPVVLDTISKIDKLGDYYLVLEVYKGLHVIDAHDISNLQNISFIVIPGIIDFVVKDSVIYANSARDLLTLEFNSPYDVSILDRQRAVFYELSPPDRHLPNPRFLEGNRLDSTEVVGWQGDSNFVKIDTLLMPYYLFALKQDYLFSILGSNVLVYDISQKVPMYRTMFQANSNFIDRIKIFSNYLMSFSYVTMRVYNISNIDQPAAINEYNGINSGVYTEFDYNQGDVRMFADYHFSPLYYTINDGLYVFDMQGFGNNVRLDTSFGLAHPLDLMRVDSLLYVCDNGIKLFKVGAGLEYLKYYQGDDLNLFRFDSVLVSLGAGQINEYLIRDTVLEKIFSLPIKFAWTVRY